MKMVLIGLYLMVAMGAFGDDIENGSRTWPVAANTKYTLSFDASFDGDIESIEENARFAVFARPGQKSPVLPYREIWFVDAEGETIGHPMIWSMPSRVRHTYTDVFHTPGNASSVRVRIVSRAGVALTVQNMTLEKTNDEGALNVNPAFEAGPMNYSGWDRISAGGRLIQIDGKTLFDTKYGSRGSRFPLPGPGTYALSAKATGNGYNCCVIVDVFDSEGKKLMKSVLRRYERTNYFVPPQGAVSASFLVYSCLLEEVRLVRVGDERAIEELQEKLPSRRSTWDRPRPCRPSRTERSRAFRAWRSLRTGGFGRRGTQVKHPVKTTTTMSCSAPAAITARVGRRCWSSIPMKVVPDAPLIRNSGWPLTGDCAGAGAIGTGGDPERTACG